MKRRMSIPIIRHLFTDKKGFTLVELIVSITIFTIILGVTATIILSSQNIFRNNASVTLAKQVGESVISFVEEDIQYATAITLKQSKDIDPNYTNALFIQDGKMYYQNTDRFSNFYGDEFYSSFNVKMYINTDDIDLTKLSIFVYDDKGDELYNSSTTITFKNYQFNQSSFIINTSGEIDLSSYSIYYNK